MILTSFMLPGVNVYERSGPYHIELTVDICTICAVAIAFLYNYYVDLVCFFHGAQTSDNVLVKTCSLICHGYTAAAVNRRIVCRYINNEVILKNIKHIIRSYNTGTEDIMDICMSELLIELCDICVMVGHFVVWIVIILRV